VIASVPPELAAIALEVPVDNVSPPSKRVVVEALLDCTEMPPPLLGVAGTSVIAPLKSLVPPLWSEMLTSWPLSSVIAPP
jgi:hypothetical protein